MSTDYNKSLLLENNTDPEVFKDMEKFELTETKNFALSIKLQFPKFSKGFSASDFTEFIRIHIGEDNVTALGRLHFPNEWQMSVKSNEIRENLIRMGRTKINSRTCWISPLCPREVRGYVHWIPNATDEEKILKKLREFGKVIFMEVQKIDLWTKVDCDSRYFALNLTNGKTMDDIPHFFKIDDHHGLITIKGRAPSCFHCRAVGHRKSECQKYREKLNSYCSRKSGSGTPRVKPRGRRYRPVPPSGNPSTSVKSKKRRKKNKTATKIQQTVAEAGSSNADQALIPKENVKTEEKLPEVDFQVGTASQMTEEIMTKFKKLQRLNELKDLSTFQSELTQFSATLDNQIEKLQKQLSLNATPAKVETDIPQESEGHPSEGKKKRRKKKKKKAAPKASTEMEPPNS